MYEAIISMMDHTLKALEKNSIEDAKAASDIEDEIDRLEEIFHERHVHRVNAGVCSFNNTEHYVEILSNIERMGDHLENVCESILTGKDSKYNEFYH